MSSCQRAVKGTLGAVVVTFRHTRHVCRHVVIQHPPAPEYRQGGMGYIQGEILITMMQMWQTLLETGICVKSGLWL